MVEKNLNNLSLEDLLKLEKKLEARKLEALDKLNLKELYLLQQDCAKRDSDA